MIFFDYILGKLRLKDTSGGGGGGTVTSVGLALPASEFNILGSPVVGAGTLTGTWKAQTANKVFAAPTSGSGAPTFRLLTAGDIPTLPYGDILSNGSVNFTAAEKWLSGINDTTVSPTGVVSKNTFTNALAELNNDGSLRLSQDTSKSQGLFKNIRVAIGTAAVRTLAHTPVLCIPALANYTTEILGAMVVWSGGTVLYDGITSLYFFTNGANSNQFQIDCPASTIPSYPTRGVPLNSIAKGNLGENLDIYVTTDFDSSAGDSDATIFIYYAQQKTS